MHQKIFGIGLNKTGSTSLYKSLVLLGYKAVHYSCKAGNIKEIVKKNIENKQGILSGIEAYEAYFDWSSKSTHAMFKQLDSEYPGSKFILHTRNIEDWIVSRDKHVKRIPNLKELQKKFPNHSWYHMNHQVWEKEYLTHHESVNDYFKDRPNDLLVFNVFEGDGWDKLCAFLGKESPNKPFPRTNTATQSIALRLIRAEMNA